MIKTIVLFILIGIAGAFRPIIAQEATLVGAGISTSLHKMATSTPNDSHQVKVLFFGQSITAQDWWLEVKSHLEETYPNTDFVFKNSAIGGFEARLLKHTLDFLVYPFYPDLIIFHDYGSEEDYEYIIQQIAQHTTAEIAIQNDHVSQYRRFSRRYTLYEVSTRAMSKIWSSIH